MLLAGELDPELADLVASDRAQHVADAGAEIFRDTALVFVATGCKGADAGWHGVAKAAGAVVNVVDYPALCDAMTPSIVDRDPVVVAIGTEGRAPVLGRRIKRRMEEILHPRLGAYAALAGRLRAEVAYRVPQQDRRGFWAWVFGGAPWATFSAGHEQHAARQIKDAIQTGGAGETGGRLSMVMGIGSDADLLPLRAVQRLQEADVIFVGRGVPDSVLELARRDAERVRMGLLGTRGQAPVSWSQCAKPPPRVPAWLPLHLDRHAGRAGNGAGWPAVRDHALRLRSGGSLICWPATPYIRMTATLSTGICRCPEEAEWSSRHRLSMLLGMLCTLRRKL